MPNVFSARDLVSRPDNMDETVLSSLDLQIIIFLSLIFAVGGSRVGGSEY